MEEDSQRVLNELTPANNEELVAFRSSADSTIPTVPNLQRPANPTTRAVVDDSCRLYRYLFTEIVRGKERKVGGECKLLFSMLTAASPKFFFALRRLVPITEGALEPRLLRLSDHV